MPKPKIPVSWDMHARFEAKLLPGPEDCWAWSGAHFKKTGYAMFSVRCADGKWRPTTAHRISWRLYRGEFEPLLELDHLCRNRACVNPWHAEPVTRSVNMLRGDHPTAILVRTGSCPRGHEMTEANTILRKTGKRECRACVQERDRARGASRKEHYRKMYLQRKARQAASGR